ncbi:unnamed protein product [Penicillium camemberti]|uniref:Str. FM013 n=1 Tax=Penicillium camemberti (strain FM 013) TaxID=1429867 RepID=A0A0G4PUE4_PENC3|nr:unnamed protein product [Penicillium camemberti]
MFSFNNFVRHSVLSTKFTSHPLQHVDWFTVLGVSHSTGRPKSTLSTVVVDMC